eukprot:scaffold44058_cov72-Phaeocystis_antarctica.AAC.3
MCPSRSLRSSGSSLLWPCPKWTLPRRPSRGPGLEPRSTSKRGVAVAEVTTDVHAEAYAMRAMRACSSRAASASAAAAALTSAAAFSTLATSTFASILTSSQCQLERERLQHRVDLLRAEVVSPQHPPPRRATVRPFGTPRQDGHLLSGQQVARHQLVVDRVNELEQCKGFVGHGLGLGVAAQELHLFDREDLALLELDFHLRAFRLVVAAARVLHEEGQHGGGPLEQHGLQHVVDDLVAPRGRHVIVERLKPAAGFEAPRLRLLDRQRQLPSGRALAEGWERCWWLAALQLRP